MSAIVSVETVHGAGDSVLKSGILKCTNSKIENITLDFSIIADWVAVGELDLLNAFKMLDPVEASLTDCTVE